MSTYIRRIDVKKALKNVRIFWRQNFDVRRRFDNESASIFQRFLFGVEKRWKIDVDLTSNRLFFYFAHWDASIVCVVITELYRMDGF